MVILTQIGAEIQKLDVPHRGMYFKYKESWSSKRQSSVSRSTTEAEYIVLSNACQEGVWLRRLLSDIKLKQVDPTTIYEDNQGAIQLSRNPKFHNRTKHIDISFHKRTS